jgi:hypothetical protein
LLRFYKFGVCCDYKFGVCRDLRNLDIGFRYVFPSNIHNDWICPTLNFLWNLYTINLFSNTQFTPYLNNNFDFRLCIYSIYPPLNLAICCRLQKLGFQYIFPSNIHNDWICPDSQFPLELQYYIWSISLKTQFTPVSLDLLYLNNISISDYVVFNLPTYLNNNFNSLHLCLLLSFGLLYMIDSSQNTI